MDIARDVRTVRFLPAYFSVISHLLALLSQEEPSIPEIVYAVGADQSLSSRLLNIVNSPFYGAVRQIGTIEEAVIRVGLAGLRNLTLAVSMNDISGGLRAEEWKHSLMTAQISEMLARKMRSAPEVMKFAFVSGLLHDLGKLFLTRRYMLDYQSIAPKIKGGMTLVDAERATFGYDHAAVGAMMLNVWNVPQVIVESIKLHHNPGQNRLATILCYSDQITHWNEQPREKRLILEIPGVGQNEIEWLYSDASAKAHEMTARIQ
jgi:putative nucleotidyltransferase with HDIG domain